MEPLGFIEISEKRELFLSAGHSHCAYRNGTVGAFVGGVKDKALTALRRAGSFFYGKDDLFILPLVTRTEHVLCSACSLSGLRNYGFIACSMARSGLSISSAIHSPFHATARCSAVSTPNGFRPGR
jgi:hypothetical protein